MEGPCDTTVDPADSDFQIDFRDELTIPRTLTVYECSHKEGGMFEIAFLGKKKIDTSLFTVLIIRLASTHPSQTWVLSLLVWC